ncbi:PREDICTED: HEAT repeat-containing protein 1 [Dinoponera quadriceps]|uniref:HEAT repeat-containing protein 1 n=1 Tax=Dinoponera quadriceps TaxID=609295 RepID=A0A6P3WPH0_DINQU|nr:PREDICTED: HEAT repeat-containing protein 1 [Dinoponera quadriceps]
MESLAQLFQNISSQTNSTLQDKKRPSLLCDPKEAANWDRQIILSIGQSGLQTLIKSSSLFVEFEGTLFSKNSLNYERAAEDITVNQEVTTEIKKFLILLSPYFLTNASHKALEWLIYRYHIHKYNRDDFILLILPYHESRIFARALQMLNLSNDDKWHWLTSLQKRGQTPVSEILVKRLSTDEAFMQILCTHVISAVETYPDQAPKLNTLYGFYTTLLLGVIEEVTTVTDVQLNYLLPTLFYGLKSPVLDIVASSYMIIAQLMTKMQLDADKTEKILLKIFKKAHLKQEATMLLLYLYQSPSNNRLTVMPQKVLLQLSKKSWFIETVAQIHSTNMNVSQFTVPFLQAACQAIAEDPVGTAGVKSMMSDFATYVKLSGNTVDAILSGVLTCKFFKSEMPQEAKDFLARFYQSFERSYPDRFDRHLKHLMKQNEDKDNARQALNFLTSWPFLTKETQESVEILDKLAHVNSVQRVRALEILARGNVNVPKSFRPIMMRTLKARFYDDDMDVVRTLLSLSSTRLSSLLPADTLVDELVTLLSTCHTASRKELAQPALKILLELCEDGDDTRVFITALPYVFPATEEDMEVATEVLRSNFGRNNIYMQRMTKDLDDMKKSKGQRSVNAGAVISVAFHYILMPEYLPATNSILDSMRQQVSHGDAASVFFKMILLGSVCRVTVGTLPARVGRDVIEIASDMIKKYPYVKPLRDCNNINGNNIHLAIKLTYEGFLPLQVGTYVLEMVFRRVNLKPEPKLDFVNNAEQSNLVVRLLEMLLEGMRKKRWREHYYRYLQIFFQIHFATMKDLVSFLSQLYINPVGLQTSYHCLQITLELLDHCSVQWVFQDLHFVTNLLLCLARPNSVCRAAAIEILRKLTRGFSLATEPLSALLQEVAAQSAKIEQDAEQLQSMLYYFLSPDPDVSHRMKQRKKLQQAQKLLFDVVLQEDVPIDRRAQLLDMLSAVNGTQILQRLAPLGQQLLQKLADESTRSRPAGDALRNILQRFDGSTVEALSSDGQVWSFFESSILQYEPYAFTASGEQTSPSVVLLKQINDTFFASAGRISRDLQTKIFSKMLDLLTDCEVSSVISNASRAIRRIRIDASLVEAELQAMKESNPEERPEATGNSRRRQRHRQPRRMTTPKIVYSRAWKRGEALLQIVQHAKNIEHEETLYAVLFDLVNVCVSLEELSPVEYTNQLILQTIHRLMTQGLPLRNAAMHIALVTKCIRTSRNPQTHHHALQVLVELVRTVDVSRALINIMPIFTFMGSTMVRQDDSYSIQITFKVLETVVPIVNAASDESHACLMLRIFVSSLPDIPEHRRIPLFAKLLELLGDKLHLYYLITFENRATKSEKTAVQCVEFALQMCQEFSMLQLLQVCTKVIKFVRDLPINIEENQARGEAMSFKYNHIYDLSKTNPKILRQYKLTAIHFLVRLLSSQEFINQIPQLSESEANKMNKYCDHLASELIALIQIILKVANQHQENENVFAKYWKILLHHLHDVLDLVNNLLSNSMFLKNVKRLQAHADMSHELLTVRKKILELLNARLLQKKFGEQDHTNLLGLIDCLVCIVRAEGGNGNQEFEVLQQTTLISLKLLAKLLAATYVDQFQPVLRITVDLLKSRDGPVLANAVLCLAELVSLMQSNAIGMLDDFMPEILKLMKTHCHQNVPDSMVVSILTALQKIVESLGKFLTRYLKDLLSELIILNSLYTDTGNPKTTVVLSRLKMISQNLSSCVPLNDLLPVVRITYKKQLKKKFYQRIPSLMNVLADSFEKAQSAHIRNEIKSLTEFFLQVLQFRESIKDPVGDEIDVNVGDTAGHVVAVEESASKAMIALMYKLNDVTFRSLYEDLYRWAEGNTTHLERNITFYRLSANMAECLKNLFGKFAGIFFHHAASLLKSNTFLNGTLHTLTLPKESDRIELIEAILLTLSRVFSYITRNTINEERYMTLPQLLVDQLENTMGTKEEYESRASRLIIPCIASFVGAVPDDMLHKELITQTLLKTKHAKPYVRSTALNALVEIARKLGEDFMPLLPESIPFLAEIMEDEDEATQQCAQNAVRTLEEILEEPLHQYF